MFAGTLASMLMLAGGWASAETTAEKDYDKAVKEMQKGYAELGQVVNDLDYDKNKTAERHFSTALKDFDKAVEYFAKVDLPADEQSAVDSLKKGSDALRKSVKELEKNDLDKAQEYYDEAQGDFVQAQASFMMDD
jgi:tetratricopeptide (TPR) repeat protein